MSRLKPRPPKTPEVLTQTSQAGHSNTVARWARKACPPFFAQQSMRLLNRLPKRRASVAAAAAGAAGARSARHRAGGGAVPRRTAVRAEDGKLQRVALARTARAGHFLRLRKNNLFVAFAAIVTNVFVYRHGSNLLRSIRKHSRENSEIAQRLHPGAEAPCFFPLFHGPEGPCSHPLDCAHG
jgi:hypothetical protein